MVSRLTGRWSATTSPTPSRDSTSRTCGAMPSPQGLSRGKSARSSSSTDAPGRTRSADSAAALPAGPAPTTMRSQSCGTAPVCAGMHGSAARDAGRRPRCQTARWTPAGVVSARTPGGPVRRRILATTSLAAAAVLAATGATGVTGAAGATRPAAAPPAQRPTGATAAGTLPGGYKHLVVIYEENHSFDNLYGTWGTVGGDRVDGLSQSRRAQRTQVAQDGTPYHCLLQADVNLTTPPLADRCADGGHGVPSSAFTNRPYSIDR